jgi:hypothetical protein
MIPRSLSSHSRIPLLPLSLISLSLLRSLLLYCPILLSLLFHYPFQDPSFSIALFLYLSSSINPSKIPPSLLSHSCIPLLPLSLPRSLVLQFPIHVSLLLLSFSSIHFPTLTLCIFFYFISSVIHLSIILSCITSPLCFPFLRPLSNFQTVLSPCTPHTLSLFLLSSCLFFFLVILF